MNIKEQLEQWIERRADNYSETMSSYEHQPSAMRGYLKGANEMKELLLIACEALEEYKKESHVLDQVCCDYGVQVGEQEWACCSQPITKAEKTLNKIQEMIKEIK